MPKIHDSVEIDYQGYTKLKKAYEIALNEKKTSFIFEEKELLTDYAYYLLQYLKPHFEDENNRNIRTTP